MNQQYKEENESPTQNDCNYASIIRFNFRSSLSKKVTDITAEPISAIGPANQTPVSPIKLGKINNSGINNITWRIKVNKTDIPAFPID